MSWQQWVLIAWIVLSIVSTVSNVVKDNKPTSSGIAASCVLVDMLLIWLVVSIPAR